MNLSGLLPLVRDVPAYRCVREQVRQGADGSSLSLLSAARPYVLAALIEDLQCPTVLLTARPQEVSGLVEELQRWLGTPERVLRFSEPEALPYERIPWSAETARERIRALAALTEWGEGVGPAPIVVTSARAIMQRTLPQREFQLGTRTIRVGQRIVLTSVLTRWLELGYEIVSVVESPGTFSRRGGIIDIHPPNAPQPVRIELFGDEVDSMRAFDPTTQRSLHRVEACTICPATEALPKFGHLAAERLGELDDSVLHGPASAEYHSDLEALQEDRTFKGIEFYIPYLYSQPSTLLDYLPEDGLLAVDDMVELGDAAAEFGAQVIELRESLQDSGELLRGYLMPYVPWDKLQETMGERRQLSLGYEGEADWLGAEEEVETPPGAAEEAPLRATFAPGPRYGGQLRRLIDDWLDSTARGERIVVVTRQARRIAELWRDEHQPAQAVTEVEAPPVDGTLTLVQGTLDEGWVLRRVAGGPVLRLFSDAEIFGWSKPRPRRPRRTPAPPEVFFADLSPGDYVVHVDFGIGRFRGLIKATIDEAEREYLRVDYAGNDSVYVPIHQADRLSRYVGASDRPPMLHQLGTASWERVKERAKEAATGVAKDLLMLYSAREVVEGHAFAPDTEWQAELEASFPYVETDDQLQAVAEVKTGMEKPRPMDRLICGDVGYGKTEVALRAAFKAVMDSKQVAVLVPTTVLAQQHYTTFRRRLAPFPVNVEMLSRFLTNKEQQEVLKRLASSEVDIVIGTHRLLSEDVSFKDLGLLIIDEEQRFGVTHKERLKRMRTEVDVLTMTATPIPRTLYMSLTGARDMSTIDTPPEERLPIKTHVGQYDETLMRKAILRELDRGGQVFFVHNRVRGIQAVRQHLERLVPEATFAVAHGQMHERDLEQVMVDFSEGQIDVLVCTTIIESGLDIPNANTIIINRANRFGLAQLYQLRGRVGRGAVRAHGYFLYDRNARVTETARRRLQAIMEASELGAGFTIAMRDLEIRGAGEILGTRQSGHMAAVGFDLYCRLLAQSVRELKGESPRELTADVRAYLMPLEQGVQITLPLDASLPADYILDDSLRLRLYRRLAGLSTVDEIDETRAELGDRFGPLPPQADNLMYQLRLKALALNVGVEAIVAEDRQIAIRSEALGEVDREGLQGALGERVRVRRREIRLSMEQEQVWRAELLRTLQVMGEWAA
ncbi:MAG TPA: transcription-repair coupling factor [Anaerolineae bacterium]|nr:transcription-repair coupling factor [Anaerolineae bacterium]